MSVSESLIRVLGVEGMERGKKIEFGEVNFEFANFTPKLSIVDLGKDDAEDLLAYDQS
ncbi:MAG TPA: hypothetical protein VJK25_03845 [Patescibacteria group bacterium]|nr:hypothetical protein [Patescibacteria group bacterium]